jgi:hypothetical protein
MRPLQRESCLQASKLATSCEPSETYAGGGHGEEPVYARRMVELLVDGLRYGASGAK